MMFDDDFLWELAKQEVQIGQNLKLIDLMVELRKTELQQKYSDELLESRAEDSTSSILLNPSSGEFVLKSGFQFEDDDNDDDDKEDSILELLLDDDDAEDPTIEKSESEKVEYFKMKDNFEKEQQEFQRELEKRKSKRLLTK